MNKEILDNKEEIKGLKEKMEAMKIQHQQQVLSLSGEISQSNSSSSSMGKVPDLLSLSTSNELLQSKKYSNELGSLANSLIREIKKKDETIESLRALLAKNRNAMLINE